MTFKEKYEKDYAEKIARDNEQFPWYGCPSDYYTDTESEGDRCPDGIVGVCGSSCAKCWNREMPEEADKAQEVKDELEINSPSKMCAEIGKEACKDFQRGMVCGYMSTLLHGLSNLGVTWTLRYRAKDKAYVLTMKEESDDA